jgi:hypothetical protein
VADVSARNDALLEALIELARSAMRADRERRAKLTVVQGDRRKDAA